MSNITAKSYQDAQDKANREAVNVASIVKVMDFDPSTMTVSVQPLSQRLEGGNYVSQPPILGVPVCLTKSGGFIFRPWIKSGDIGAVVYIDHDIDKAISGQEAPPNTERNHSTSDAVFIGGIVPGGASVEGLPDDAAVLSSEDGSVYIAITADKIEIKGDVEIDGDVKATGTITP